MQTVGAPSVKEVLEGIKGSVEWVHLQFTDILGYLRQVTVHASLLDEDAFERGLGKLDGSSVEGFSDIQESDLVLKPLPHTLAVLPWARGVARLISRVYKPGGVERLPRDPALALERAVEYAKGLGYEVFMSAELEFHVFTRLGVTVEGYRLGVEIETLEAPNGSNRFFTLQGKAYFVPEPFDSAMAFKLELGSTLRSYFDVPAEVMHHETSAGGQVEVNYKHSDPVTAADRLQTIKYVARNVAARHGLVAVFLPKPIPTDSGNGLHVHVSLWSRGRNAFHDESDEYAGLSGTARHFIGGLLEHARALAALTNPTVNSYRRLIPGYEAPVYLVWGRANRSAAVRIPSYFKGDEATKRIEYRVPDPTANPYLAFAGIIMAGLDGVKRRLDPGDPLDENAYALGAERRRALGIRELPRSLEEALDELESDNEWLKPALDSDVIQAYIELKRAEARMLAAYASPMEYAVYMGL